MKVRWTLFDMTPIRSGHLEANIRYWKYDWLFKTEEFIRRLDKSVARKVLSKVSGQAKMLFDMVYFQKQFTRDQINEIVDYKIVEPDEFNNGVVVFELFVNSVFFESHDAIQNQLSMGVKHMKRFKRARVISRQHIIDQFEKEMFELYTDAIHGEVLEDDGKSLTCVKYAEE